MTVVDFRDNHAGSGCQDTPAPAPVAVDAPQAAPAISGSPEANPPATAAEQGLVETIVRLVPEYCVSPPLQLELFQDK
jgi:hypothetical protein